MQFQKSIPKTLIRILLKKDRLKDKLPVYVNIILRTGMSGSIN